MKHLLGANQRPSGRAGLGPSPSIFSAIVSMARRSAVRRYIGRFECRQGENMCFQAVSCVAGVPKPAKIAMIRDVWLQQPMADTGRRLSDGSTRRTMSDETNNWVPKFLIKNFDDGEVGIRSNSTPNRATSPLRGKAESEKGFQRLPGVDVRRTYPSSHRLLRKSNASRANPQAHESLSAR